MDQQTTPAAPRYGAATLGEPVKTTSTVTRIKWGGVIKGVLAVTAVAAVGIGAYYGAAWLFGGAPAGSALAQIGSVASELGSGLMSFVNTTIPAWFHSSVVPFFNEWLIPHIGHGVSAVLSWIGSGLSSIGVISPDTAANMSALARPELSGYIFGGGAATAASNNAALVAGAAGAVLAAPTAVHMISNTQMVEHAVQEHVTHIAGEHAAERAAQANARRAATWSDRVGQRPAATTPTPRSSSYMEQVEADTAKLNAALSTHEK